MNRRTCHPAPALVLVFGVFLSVLCGCQSHTASPSAIPGGNTANEDMSSTGSTGTNAAAPASANPADYNSSMSARQRDIIQSHKDRQ